MKLGPTSFGTDHQRTALVAPGCWPFDEAIIRSRHEQVRFTIPLELESGPRPARQRDGVILGTIDGSLGGVLLEHMHPPLREEPVASAALGGQTLPPPSSYSMPLRVVSRAVRMRRTCSLVNMNMPRSSV
jgi:hypothetical protein